MAWATASRVAGADRLGGDRIECKQGAHTEDRRGEEVDRAECDRGERLGGEVAHHDGVDDAHRHEAELHGGDRQRQGHHLAETGATGKERTSGSGEGWREGARPAGLEPATLCLKADALSS